MATKVLVPLLGEGVEEVTVIKWLKQEGDFIKELEPLLEVNTDKVDTEIPAPASRNSVEDRRAGRRTCKGWNNIGIYWKPGETVDSGQLSVVMTNLQKWFLNP